MSMVLFCYIDSPSPGLRIGCLFSSMDPLCIEISLLRNDLLTPHLPLLVGHTVLSVMATPILLVLEINQRDPSKDEEKW